MHRTQKEMANPFIMKALEKELADKVIKTLLRKVE